MTAMSNPAPIQPSGHVPAWTLGDRLAKARSVAGLTQAQLAELIGIGVKTVIRYENGESTKRAAVIAWAFATGVDLRWIETGEATTDRDGGPDQGITGTGCYGDNVVKFPSRSAA